MLLLTVVRAPRRTPPAAAADIDQQLSWYAAPALSNKRGRPTDDAPHRLVFYSSGGSIAEWLACWTQAQKGLRTNRSRDAVG